MALGLLATSVTLGLEPTHPALDHVVHLIQNSINFATLITFKGKVFTKF